MIVKPPSYRLVSQANTVSFICHRCKTSALRLPRKSYSTSSTTTIPPPSGRVRLRTRRLIHVSGTDSARYLQGSITSNIYERSRTDYIGPRETPFYSAFLNAKGRVLHDVFMYPISTAVQKLTHKFGAGNWGPGQSWLIEADEYYAPKLVDHIKKYRLSAKFDVRLMEEGEAAIWSIWDDGAKGGNKETVNGPSHHISCLDERAPGFGKRVIVPYFMGEPMSLGPEDPDSRIPETTEENYKIRRYLHGIAEGQKEMLRDSAFPQACNLDIMGALDYHKGCYVGQERTIRTHHKGVVRRRILPLMLYPHGGPQPQTLEYKGEGPEMEAAKKIKAEAEIKSTAASPAAGKGPTPGKWLDGVGNLGLGEVLVGAMTPALVHGDVGTHSGYQKDNEFQIMIDAGTPLGVSSRGSPAYVKAFMPQWWKVKERSDVFRDKLSFPKDQE